MAVSRTATRPSAAARRLPRGWATSRSSSPSGSASTSPTSSPAASPTARASDRIRERRVDHRAPARLPLDGRADAAARRRELVVLIQATSLTYWLSQFAVVGLALIWVYFKAHERFYGFRNTLIVGNLIGLVGYVLLPTAPPRMFPEAGLHDTLAAHSTVNHSSTFVAFASNPYAAMPSLHALDALIVGVVMATVVQRRWAKCSGSPGRRGSGSRDGDRQPLLARRRRGHPGRGGRRRDRLPPRRRRSA